MPVSWHIAEGLVFVVSDEVTTFDEWRDAVEAAMRAAFGALGR